ncbi:MAG: hypothetical protein WCK29_04055 [archaeon]
MNEDALERLIKNSVLLKKLLDEINRLLEIGKNKNSFSARESKNLDLKVLDFMDVCANEMLKVDDLMIRDEIGWNLYLMYHEFYLDDGEEESILSEPVDDLFFEFQTKKDPKKIIEKIESVRERLKEFYVGF